MQNFLKGKFGTILILLATLVLAGVAIFTAVRLYDLRSQPVAPNVPSSIPHASELSQLGGPCGGNVATPLQCAAGLTCVVAQGAPADVGGTCQTPSTNTCSLSFSLTAPQCIPQTFVGGSISAGINNTTNVSCDFGKEGLDCIAATATINGTDSNCTYTSSNGTTAIFSCNVPFTTGMTASCNTFTNVTVPSSKSNCCAGAHLVTSGSPTPTPTATPVPQCNDVCTSSAQCSTDQTCNIPSGSTTGNCRNPSCTDQTSCICTTATPTATPTLTPTPTGTPNSCNGTCGSNFNCQGGLMCYQGFCRNPSCASNSSCSCGGSTPTPTPTQAALPNTGVDWPTTAGFGIGVFVILGSLLLAL